MPGEALARLRETCCVTNAELNALLDIAEAAPPIAAAIKQRAVSECFAASFPDSEWRGFTTADEDRFLDSVAALEATSGETE